MRLQDLVTAAGGITLFRLVLAGAAPWWATSRLALLVYLIAIASDVLDGEVARRTGTSTRAGATFDAWVDKALHVNLGWTLAVRDVIPDWFMLAWCAREILQGPFVPILVHRFRTGKAPVPRTSPWGRATAVALFLSVGVTLLGRDATVLTVLTGILGTIAGIRYLSVYLPRRAATLSGTGFPLETRRVQP